jgi:hypothetical protein
MGKISVICFLCLGWYGCRSSNCDKKEFEKSIVGLYRNDVEKEAIHTLEILADGSYTHKYQKIGEIKVNNGSWSKKLEKCELVFNQWQNFGYYAERDGCINGCSYFVYVEKDILIFSLDLTELNFKKIK